MKHLTGVLALLVFAALASCAQVAVPPVPVDFARDHPNHPWKRDFKKGVESAKADIRRGTLRYELNDTGEWEHMQILWCFRKILAEKYGVELRVRGHLKFYETALPRITGHPSVMDPHLTRLLGEGWRERIWKEAEAFHRQHWPEVERQYQVDESVNDPHEYFESHPPPTAAERQSANPMNKYSNYQDEKRR